MRFTITTLGCKVNQHDGAAIAARLRRLHLRDARAAAPDLVVVNTCCVTHAAMRKSRQAIRRAIRNAPRAAVLVAGCYADYQPDALASLLAGLNIPPGKAFVAGHHSDLAQCLQHVARSLAGAAQTQPAPPGPLAQPCGDLHLVGGNNIGRDNESMSAGCSVCCTNTSKSIKTRRLRAVKNNVAGTRNLGPIDRFDGHQRAFVKVQDGCDAFCSYCVVPYTRPVVWSPTIEQVESQCRLLVAAGHKEIVLSGVFLGAFGRRTAVRRRWKGKASPLGELIRRLGGMEGLWRLRLSSLEPADLTEGLIAACGQAPNFAPHFHLPLQSGSPEVLRRMNRQYAVDDYLLAIERARAAFDRPAITTDVIVGFPGEGHADFRATLDVCRKAGFAKIHAFPFSPLEGTAAWAYRSQAPAPAVVKQRMNELAELERELASAYRGQFVGQDVEALVEKPKARQGRSLEAITDRYQTVRFPAPPSRRRSIVGKVVRLAIDKITASGLSGRFVEVLF